MSNKNLKNRLPFASTLDKNLYEKFNKLHEDTKIPKSKLHDEAIKNLLEKYNKKSNS
ncbi:MAG: ribbon-helix-helix domain-containing protein [Clostridia bacterium]|nr:ribbon-helix-helix domain-containing protein [Clostridia bacterium]